MISTWIVFMSHVKWWTSFLDCTNSNRVTLFFKTTIENIDFSMDLFKPYFYDAFWRFIEHPNQREGHSALVYFSVAQGQQDVQRTHDGCFYVHATCMCIICIYFNTLTQSVSRDTQNTRGKNKKWEKNKRQNAFSDKCGRKKIPPIPTNLK